LLVIGIVLLSHAAGGLLRAAARDRERISSEGVFVKSFLL
jgi:hypothetical protein